MLSLISHIKSLVGTHTHNELLRAETFGLLSQLENAYLIIENDVIHSFGEMKNLPEFNFDIIIDAKDKYILPTYCDSHTHLVFAATRESEFAQRIAGMTYQEIATAGGGIINSAQKLSDCDESKLYDAACIRLHECIAMGTGAMEIKSGYGLNTAAELKMLRVIKKLKENSPIPIRSTFLGAHAYPIAYKENHQRYIDIITNEMLPQIAEEGLADYCDAFVERGFFSADEVAIIFEKATRLGIKIKVHANQLSNSGGVQLGIHYNACSVDHLEHIGLDELKLLSQSNTIATLLPSAAFFLNEPMPDARALITHGAAVSLASDYNPGSSPSGNMNFVMSLAAIKMKMTTAECINAATHNAAHAMDIEHLMGNIQIGKKANLIITETMNSLDFIPYNFGSPSIENIIINGRIF